MTAATIAHETSTRLRLRMPTEADLEALHDALESLPGVTALRLAPAARSVVVTFDGRAATRREVLACAERHSVAVPAQDRRRPATASGLPLEGPVREDVGPHGAAGVSPRRPGLDEERQLLGTRFGEGLRVVVVNEGQDLRRGLGGRRRCCSLARERWAPGTKNECESEQ